MLLCHLFDVHSTFCGVNDHILFGSTIQQHTHIIFLWLIRTRIKHILSHQYLTNQFTCSTCLNGNQSTSQHVGSNFSGLTRIFCHLYPALFAALDFTLPSSAGMYLGFHHTPIRLKLFFNFLGGFRCLFGCFRYESFLNGNTVLFKNFFGLILVDIHVVARMLDYCGAKITNFDPI